MFAFLWYTRFTIVAVIYYNWECCFIDDSEIDLVINLEDHLEFLKSLNKDVTDIRLFLENLLTQT